MQENNNLKVNPELFKGEAPKELKAETYYAYLDSIEQTNNMVHLRFDCIHKNIADNTSINKESILDFPSIIIEIYDNVKDIRKDLRYSNLYLLESHWFIISTAIKKTHLQQEQYFNFVQVGDSQTKGNYDLDEVVLPRDMDDVSRGKINDLITATTIIESPVVDVQNFLNNLNLDAFSHVNVYDVGQGNCNGLVSYENNPLLYFDIGGGAGANKKTYPVNFKLCNTKNPPVILSHWDTDHIQTAVYDSQILNSKWLVPIHSSISATAMHIAQSLINRGNLVCWNNSLPNYLTFKNHIIVKCEGKPNNKNNSGLALFVNYCDNNYVLLPGDATYNKISYYPTNNLIGLVASHHGAKGAIRGLPSGKKPVMLAYSFGNKNTHKHPHKDACKTYKKHRWGKGLATIKGSIAMMTGITNLNPPCFTKKSNCSLSISQQY